MRAAIISICLAIQFLTSVVGWADAPRVLTPSQSSDILAAESRFKPFFERHSLDFQNLFTVVYAAGQMKDLVINGTLRTSHLVKLNRLFPDKSVEIYMAPDKPILKCTGREYGYALFHFKKDGKLFKALFIRDHQSLTALELGELGIKTEEDKQHFHSPVLPGIWFVNTASKTQSASTETRPAIGSATLAFRIMNALLSPAPSLSPLVEESINIMVTHRCPFNCRHCLAKDAMRAARKMDADKKQLFTLFDQLRGFKKAYLVGPGEPLAYGKDKHHEGGVTQDFIDIVRHAARNIQEVHMVTNGYLIPEDAVEARRFFAQFPENIVWQLSVDTFHEEQFARIPGRDDNSLRRVVRVMENLADEGLIRTAYSVRNDPARPSNVLSDYDLWRKRDRDPKTVFVNSVIAQGNAIDDVPNARRLDVYDIIRHGSEPNELFPFVDTEGYLVTSDHVAYMNEEQRIKLAWQGGGIQDRMILGNVSRSSVGDIILNRLILGNFSSLNSRFAQMYMTGFDLSPILEPTITALIRYYEGDKKKAMDIMAGSFSKKGLPRFFSHIVDAVSLEDFIIDCEENGITIIERRGDEKIDLASAIEILHKRPKVYADFEKAIASESEYRDGPMLLYFQGRCPVYSHPRSYWPLHIFFRRFKSPDPARFFYVAMLTKSLKDIEELYKVDMKLAEDGIVDYPVGAIYDEKVGEYYYVKESIFHLSNDREFDTAIRRMLVPHFLANGPDAHSDIARAARRIGKFAAKLDKHGVIVPEITRDEHDKRVDMALAVSKDGKLRVQGDYSVKHGTSISTQARAVFRDILINGCEMYGRERHIGMKDAAETSFDEGYDTEINRVSTALAPVKESGEEEAARIHAENLKFTPDIPKDTIVCHIVADSILPPGQRNMLKRLEQKLRVEEGYNERVVCLSVGDGTDSRRFMNGLREAVTREAARYGGYNILFDVACPTKELVERIHREEPGIRALAFAKEGDGDIVQVEGIILALRALQTNSVDNLLRAYTFLTGKEMMASTNDINKLARTLLFVLPTRRVDFDRVSAINKLIEENILNAA